MFLVDSAQDRDLAPFLEIWAKIKKPSKIKPPLIVPYVQILQSLLLY